MNSIVAFYQSVPPEAWALLFGTPAIVAFVELVKRVAGVHSKAVIHILTTTSAFLVTALPLYVLNNPKPFEFLGAYTATFFMLANLLYAVSKTVAPFMAQVKAYEDRKQRSATPVAAPAIVQPKTPALNSIGEYDG